MKVVLTERAIGDLVRIGGFIGQDNPVRAATFVAELEARCLQLAEMPRAYPLVPRYEGEGIRRRPHRDYLIFYRIDEAAGQVVILHVLHGAQDYDAILFPDGRPS